jgi:hypothetical protein
MVEEPTPLSLISDRQDRLKEDIERLEGETKEIPVLRKEVGLLREAVDRNTNVIYRAAGAFLGLGVLSVVSALIVKGVIG